MFLVQQGFARIARLLDSGGELTLDIAGPGDLIGEIAAFGEKRRAGLAQAIEPLRVLSLPAAALESAARRHPELALELAHVLAERAARLEARAALNALGDCRARLAGVLIELAERFGQREVSGCRIGLRLTHQELARLIGAARETVTPLLVELRRQGTIDYDRRRILIRDRAALAHP